MTATASRVRGVCIGCGAGIAAAAGLLVGGLLGDFNIRAPVAGIPEASAAVQLSLPIVRAGWYLTAVVTVGFLLAAAAAAAISEAPASHRIGKGGANRWRERRDVGAAFPSSS